MTVRDIEPDSAQNLPPADQYAVASSIVLRQLTLAPKTRAQLAEKLAKKGTPPQVAMAVLDRFTELGYVDDFAYAQMFIRSKIASRQLSRRALAFELTKCGIDKVIIEQALAQVTEDDELQAGRLFVAKKLRTMRTLDDDTKERRLMGALARKGYSSALALRIIRESLSDLSPDQ